MFNKLKKKCFSIRFSVFFYLKFTSFSIRLRPQPPLNFSPFFSPFFSSLLRYWPFSLSLGLSPFPDLAIITVISPSEVALSSF
ncbi:hypothetical protein L1987_58156 [Smallanthus sonchifolius]|uniref:Uncharacterized protein n=1 Tax=Smallanthus sonchifolius TaxID=185202 RepID=A0ACB9DEZ6_9ASTR|nr:hypothetical protein L1987_58156 [Smallanthus sonchifolius]